MLHSVKCFCRCWKHSKHAEKSIQRPSAIRPDTVLRFQRVRFGAYVCFANWQNKIWYIWGTTEQSHTPSLNILADCLQNIHHVRCLWKQMCFGKSARFLLQNGQLALFCVSRLWKQQLDKISNERVLPVAVHLKNGLMKLPVKFIDSSEREKNNMNASLKLKCRVSKQLFFVLFFRSEDKVYHYRKSVGCNWLDGGTFRGNFRLSPSWKSVEQIWQKITKITAWNVCKIYLTQNI